ncbi:MAG: starch-binding protein, partial [Ruminococcus sp.]|nr:starch-binding protein [Ruminococcus sp.]
MQSKHSKSRSLKLKVVAPVLAAVLTVSGVVPAVTAGMHSASAASVDGETGASTTYNAPVNANNNDNKNNIFWTNATYYDYLTDDEKSGGWITGLKQYGTGFNGSEDEWFPYYGFNNLIKGIANSNSNWSKPLYFGNFCNTPGSFDTSPHHRGSAWHSGYDEAVAQTVRFDYAANNSNGLSNMYQSYQGLMQNTLDANGNLMATSTLKAPYFDPDQLGSYATVINSKFPFRTSVVNGVTKYEFDSTNAKDNVYFNWNGTTPTAVNYGSGTSHGVRDGIQYFMNPAGGQTSGYGIFPFNNRSSTTTGTRYVYFDSKGWANTYCYFYNDFSQTVGPDWPGTKMNTYSGGGSNVRVAIPDGATRCVFNNGAGSQTDDVLD